MAESNAFERSRELFQRALDLPPTQRQRLLDQQCGEDRDLREEVDSLLRAHDETSDEFEPTVGIAEQPGDRIGHYKLLKEIGEGGFGTVWMAEQLEPVRRKVALKVIKIGMDTKQVVARFEAERQTLAMMNHPHIAKVLDGGATPTGRPYFVMELVRGDPIVTFCDNARLDTKQRLALFMLVCRAVQHAHQKGVIHRDLKPSNILITLEDGVPAPKVIDFGIAKATSVELTQRTMFTEFRQMLGTPEYMAPEQAEMSELGVDTRADIYSLGVLLYELLTGTRPFDFRALLKKGYAEMLRVIKEEDPPKPSTRVTTLGDRAPDVIQPSPTRGKTLSRSLRGDLDQIVMKALEKDRARRYEAASELAEDLGRHLRHEAVTAGAPSVGYRLRKYLMRHRVGVTAGAAVLTALVLGLSGAIWGLVEARAQTARAEDGERAGQQQALRANTVVGLVEDMLSSADPHEVKGKDYTVRQLLDDFDRGLGATLANEPEVEARIRRLLGRAYSSLGLYDKAEPHLDRALSIRRDLHGARHEDVALSQLDQALLLHYRGEYENAVALLDQARITFEDDGAVENLACALAWKGDFLRHQGHLQQAERAAREAIALQRSVPDGQQGLALSLGMLAPTLLEQGEHAEAEKTLREALALERELELTRGEHPNTALTMNGLALVLVDRGNLDEAEATIRAALAQSRRLLSEPDPLIATILHNLAVVHSHQRRLPEAETVAHESLAMRRELFGKDAPQLTPTLCALGGILSERGKSERGKLDEAIPLLREALAIQEAAAEESKITFRALHNLGHALGVQGQHAEAERYTRRAWEGRRRWLGDDAKGTLRSLENLAGHLESLDRCDEALPMRRELLARCRRTWGEDHRRTQYALHALGWVLGAMGRHDESEPFTREAWELGRRVFGESDVVTLASAENLARSVEIQRRWDDAIALRKELLPLQRQKFGDDHPTTLHALYRLGRALGMQDLHAEAEPWTRESWVRSRSAQGATYAWTLAAHANLAWHLSGLERWDEAVPMWLEFVAEARRAGSKQPGGLASDLARAGSALLDARRFGEAEPILRECLTLRAEASPKAWQYYHALSLLGAALSGQGEHESADPLLVEGFEKMQPPPANTKRKRNALERLIRHYDDWGRPADASAYRKKLDAMAADPEKQR